jgi:hypothetical protein
MNAQPPQRPEWEIDQVLQALIGQDVRVAAGAFCASLRDGLTNLPLIPVRDLFLPDNTQPSGLPVYFEGKLLRHWRRIAVVYALLEAPTLAERAPEGTAPFRGRMAVILSGPALVQLAFPFAVEKLPADSGNYWRDLHVPCAQLEFPFSEAGTSVE